MNALQFRAYGDALALTGRTHADYARCATLAAKYRAFATGAGLGAYLQRYDARETAEQFAGRLRLTGFITPAIWNSLERPFARVARLRQGVTRRFDYAKAVPVAEAEAHAVLLEKVLLHYAGPEFELADYLAQVNAETTADTDPNAWVLTEFQAFDYRLTQPRPYPVLIPTEAAVDFTHAGGELTSFTVRTLAPVPAAAPANTAPLFRYTSYLENDCLDYWPLLRLPNGNYLPTRPEGTVVAWVAEVDPTSPQAASAPRYEVVLSAPRAGRVPAHRVGYVPDRETQGRTYVSPLHAAVVWLEKTLKLGSEADIATAQAAHPHKAEFTRECPGAPPTDFNPRGSVCINGRTQEGGTCGICGGTGLAITQTGSGDIFQVPLPPNVEDWQHLPDLKKMVVFNAPPTDMLVFQQETLDRYERKAHLAVFNTDSLVQVSGPLSKTATEFASRKDEANNTLAPFAECLSRQYRAHAMVSAAYLDVAANLDVVHRFPADLKLRTREDLYAEMEQVKKAGAASFAVEALNQELAQKLYLDAPLELEKYATKARFMTFMGKDETTVLAYFGAGYCSVEDRVLNTHIDRIMSEVEQAEGPQFYAYAYPKQLPLVMAKVAEIVAGLPQAQAPPLPTFRPVTVPVDGQTT